MHQYQFVPQFVVDQWQGLERCKTKPFEAEQRLEVQQTAFLHFDSCLPFEFVIVVPDAVIARYGVALELVDNLPVSELDDIDVGLGRAGAIVQADVVRNKILSQERSKCCGIFGPGRKYMYGIGANKATQYALKLFGVVYDKGFPIATNAFG